MVVVIDFCRRFNDESRRWFGKDRRVRAGSGTVETGECDEVCKEVDVKKRATPRRGLRGYGLMLHHMKILGGPEMVHGK